MGVVHLVLFLPSLGFTLLLSDKSCSMFTLAGVNVIGKQNRSGFWPELE